MNDIHRARLGNRSSANSSGYEQDDMMLFDRLLQIPITTVLIVGGYQFYFWAQRQTWYSPSYLTTYWDRLVKFDPRWIWIYSGLYYPMIVLAGLAQPDWQKFAIAVGGFLFLLASQVCFFLFFPVAIPDGWRIKARASSAAQCCPRSMRFLELVWAMDKPRNSMPSMHVSMATMVDLTISWRWPDFIYIGWLFPMLIGISALKIKQHYVVDIVPGALAGAAAFYAWYWIVE
jgi:membrane-associated phospholipid phosphatase